MTVSGPKLHKKHDKAKIGHQKFFRQNRKSHTRRDFRLVEFMKFNN